ncbi:MAG: hypothetical protein LCH32_01105 [Bacteroidetes bacterium]|nr:hypothetical protein [Bacteroidota bacterium]
MKEQVLITQLRITKAGQVKHFQVKLPKNAKRIIGIEVGGRLIKIPKTDGTGIEVTPKEAEAIKQP